MSLCIPVLRFCVGSFIVCVINEWNKLINKSCHAWTEATNLRVLENFHMFFCEKLILMTRQAKNQSWSFDLVGRAEGGGRSQLLFIMSLTQTHASHWQLLSNICNTQRSICFHRPQSVGPVDRRNKPQGPGYFITAREGSEDSSEPKFQVQANTFKISWAANTRRAAKITSYYPNRNLWSCLQQQRKDILLWISCLIISFLSSQRSRLNHLKWETVFNSHCVHSKPTIWE